jgi:hypothetical protein
VLEHAAVVRKRARHIAPRVLNPFHEVAQPPEVYHFARQRAAFQSGQFLRHAKPGRAHGFEPIGGLETSLLVLKNLGRQTIRRSPANQPTGFAIAQILILGDGKTKFHEAYISGWIAFLNAEERLSAAPSVGPLISLPQEGSRTGLRGGAKAKIFQSVENTLLHPLFTGEFRTDR